MAEDKPEISALRGDLIRRVVPSVTTSRLRGALTEKEKPKDPNFAVAATLNIEGDEDGPPIARSVTEPSVTVRFASVADGLGGSGFRRVLAEIDGKKEEKTMAYVAARAAQIAVENVLNSNPKALSGTAEEAQLAIQRGLSDSFSGIKAEKTSSALNIRGRGVSDYPTTFSSVLVQETSDAKRVIILWKGDSPIFVFTPDKIFTTVQSGHGDRPMGEDIIYSGHYDLNVRQLDFPADTPILAVAASDGLLKFKLGEPIKFAKDFILNGVQNNEPNKIGDKLRDEYQRRKELGQVELDDTTIAMVSSMKLGEISKLSASAPLQTIF